MSDPYAALRDRLWYPNYPMEGRDMNHDLRDESLIRQQSQRLAHQRPLEGMDYPQPFMTWKGWAVCAVTIFALVWYSF